MVIHLIRHAHAGSRSAWTDDDARRPLSDKGWLQAHEIGRALEGAGIDELWSSRYVRCRQTLDPLAERLGMEIHDRDDLAEGASGAASLDLLLAGCAGGKTLAACSHGDVIPAAVAAALGRGAELEGPAALKKGARYVLHVVDGAVSRTVHHPVPDVTAGASAAD